MLMHLETHAQINNALSAQGRGGDKCAIYLMGALRRNDLPEKEISILANATIIQTDKGTMVKKANGFVNEQLIK